MGLEEPWVLGSKGFLTNNEMKTHLVKQLVCSTYYVFSNIMEARLVLKTD